MPASWARSTAGRSGPWRSGALRVDYPCRCLNARYRSPCPAALPLPLPTTSHAACPGNTPVPSPATPAPCCSFRAPVDTFSLWVWIQLYRPPTGTELDTLQVPGCRMNEGCLSGRSTCARLQQCWTRCTPSIRSRGCSWCPPRLPSALMLPACQPQPIPAPAPAHAPAHSSGGGQQLVPAGPPWRLQLSKPAGARSGQRAAG